MKRTLPIAAALLALTTMVVLVQANPLQKIKESAHDSRDAMERQSEEVATEADKHEGHAGHEQTGENHGNHEGHGDPAKMGHDDDDDENEVEITSAMAVMFPTEGSSVEGVVTFAESPIGVTVTAVIHGLSPNAKHGFHIHEFGDLSDPAGKAAGGHYNPEGHDHALPTSDASMRHAGDLGNLEADAEGNATYSETFDNITIFDDDKNPIIGRGVIIHAKVDDGGQPTGNAGDRIAQGVIGVAKPVE